MEFTSVKSILLDSEKKELSSWIIRESRNKQTPSGLEIRRKAVEIRNKRNDESTPRFKFDQASYNWLKTFMDSDKSLCNIQIVQSKQEQRIEKIEIWQNGI